MSADSERPDWSGLLPAIRAARAVLETPAAMDVARRNQPIIARLYPVVDLHNEAELHHLFHHLAVTTPHQHETMFLSLVPLIPEGVQ